MFFNQDNIRVYEVRVEASNGVTSRYVPKEDGVEFKGSSWPAAWSDSDLRDDKFGFGETIDRDELSRRKKEAKEETREEIEAALEEL